MGSNSPLIWTQLCVDDWLTNLTPKTLIDTPDRKTPRRDSWASSPLRCDTSNSKRLFFQGVQIQCDKYPALLESWPPQTQVCLIQLQKYPMQLHVQALEEWKIKTCDVRVFFLGGDSYANLLEGFSNLHVSMRGVHAHLLGLAEILNLGTSYN